MDTFSEYEIREQVLQSMRQLGISPLKDINLILDGEIHRYAIEGDKATSKNGAYCIHADGIPAGFLQNWKTGLKTNWKFDTGKSDKDYSYFYSKEYRQKQEKEKKQKEEELKAKQSDAAEKARVYYEQFDKDPYNHPYLTKKNILPYNIRINTASNALAVPLKDINGKFISLQWIEADGKKTFFNGTTVKGGFWSIALDTVKGNPSDVVLLGEGVATMAKIYELTNLPCVAAMNCGKLSEIAQILKNKYPKTIIIITADDDKSTELKTGKNPGIEAARQAVKSGFARTFLAPPFKNTDEGTDWDDFALKYGDEITRDILNGKISFACMSFTRQRALSQVEQINAQDLRSKEFEPLKWAIEGFLPSGLAILAGGPKVGKSILSLHLSLSVAIGGCALGKIFVEQGDVLYLALEDTQRRLQQRIEQSTLPENCDLSRLTLATKVPRQHEGGLEYIRWWLELHKNARLVIIDTLQKFRKLLSGKNSMYTEDYDAIGDIKALADEFNTAFLVIHHLKKAMSDDWLNELSGSQGIAGAADTIFSLKRSRTENFGILHRTGRDVEEKDFTLQLDGFGWTLREDAEAFTMPKWKKDSVDYLKVNKSVTPMILSQALDIPINTARQNLVRLNKEGIIKKSGYGTYELSK